ncbi:MAG: sigma-70 family RNA polymerase sigma factor [Deltaproteobacteria bacterium]|nr:sigma-70 family RNA polymerase sigma factor [Deltaproteobacteria bacterium]MBN2671829.1 sigma-70 family RNA polymerase sigma factor [Deltaproteobacteria bacterium]
MQFLTMKRANRQKTENIRFVGNDEALTQALKQGNRFAQEEFYQRYAKHVRGVLVRVLGTNIDIKDHLHNVFIQAFTSVESIHDGKCLKQWLTTVAVYTAIAHIKSSQRKRWLVFVEPEAIPDHEFVCATAEQREAVRQVYTILEKMTPEDRVVFCLRVIDGMPLKDLSQIFGVSLATIKRRISRAKSRFSFLMQGNPVLLELASQISSEELQLKNG